MKKLLISFLAVIILFQCSMKLAIVAHYQLNKEYITTYLCENKDKPEMKCNGKCYLSKKIKTQDEKESKLPSLLKETESILLYCSSFDIFIPITSLFKYNFLTSFYLLKPYQKPLLCIFQPPQ